MARPAEGAHSFLIVRRDNIGDLVCTTPLMAALRAAYPDAYIAALVNTYNAEVLARNPALDAVHAYEKLKHRRGTLLGNLFSTARLMLQLRSRRFQHVLLPVDSAQSRAIATRVSGRQVWVLPRQVPPGLHEVERTFALGESLGLSGTPGPMRVYPDPLVVQAMKEKHAVAGRPTAVHISARRPAQRWPLERYVELVGELGRQGEVTLLWAPGPKDDPRHPGDDNAARHIADRAPCKAVATPDLATLIAALSLAGKVVCPDGGAMHLAAALGRPVVALFGDSPVERWRPWGVPYRVVRPESRDLRDLPLGPVLDALAALPDVGEP